MKIESLGHVVIKVRDLKVAEEFYNQVLGIPIQSRSEAEHVGARDHNLFELCSTCLGNPWPAEHIWKLRKAAA